MPGLEVFFIGPTDLSISRGVQSIVLGTDGHLFLDVCRRLNAVKS